MNDKLDAKKKKPIVAETPVHTIREGAVAAAIWRRQSPSGFAYYDFSLTRSWKSLSSGNTGYSRNFFSCNRAELRNIIDKASQLIEQHEVASLEPEKKAAA
jgi:hypothetical protein